MNEDDSGESGMHLRPGDTDAGSLGALYECGEVGPTDLKHSSRVMEENSSTRASHRTVGQNNSLIEDNFERGEDAIERGGDRAPDVGACVDMGFPIGPRT